VLIHPWDQAASDDEWVAFARAQQFGHFVAAGRGRDVPVVVPTQFALVDASLVVLHLARPNPVWGALDENPAAVLSVAGDWAYIPAAWKAIGDEDPRMGIPTTYYAAVQLIGTCEVIDDAETKAEILRTQLGVTEPGSDVADPAEHGRRLNTIRGIRLHVEDVRAKFKYGGNVDAEHRREVAARLAERAGPGDAAALTHLSLD
jgi:transcriptional regulator